MKRFRAELLRPPAAVPPPCPQPSAAATDFDRTTAGTFVPPTQKPGSTFIADAANRSITFTCGSGTCFAGIVTLPSKLHEIRIVDVLDRNGNYAPIIRSCHGGRQ
jgi:hypothetical protein